MQLPCRPAGTATAHVIRTLHGVPAPRSREHAVQLGLPARAASQGLGQSPSLECIAEGTPQISSGRVSDGTEEITDQDLVRTCGMCEMCQVSDSSHDRWLRTVTSNGDSFHCLLMSVEVW